MTPSSDTRNVAAVANAEKARHLHFGGEGLGHDLGEWEHHQEEEGRYQHGSPGHETEEWRSASQVEAASEVGYGRPFWLLSVVAEEAVAHGQRGEATSHQQRGLDDQEILGSEKEGEWSGEHIADHSSDYPGRCK